MTVVKLNRVQKLYSLGKTQVQALKGLSFSVKEGDFLSVAGPSGSGKTTLLNMIGCIDVPSAGSVHICGRNTLEMTDREITDIRHSTIGFIFQTFNLVPVLNVHENIQFPLLLRRGIHQSKELKEWTDYLIESVGLADRKEHRPNELSGGQRQRVAIARSLVMRPKVVLADEPTANLDSRTGEAMVELMKKINQEQKTSFIFSTHDKSIVDIAKQRVFIRDGGIERIEEGEMTA